MSAHAQTRNPHGVADVKPIALRLLPEERDQAEQLSQQADCSMSSLARSAYLKGLPLVIEELAANPADLPA